MNRLKIVLAEKGRTQKEISDYLKIGSVSVSRWCTNDVQPSLETLFKIADFLDVKVCDLLVERKVINHEP